MTSQIALVGERETHRSRIDKVSGDNSDNKYIYTMGSAKIIHIRNLDSPWGFAGESDEWRGTLLCVFFY